MLSKNEIKKIALLARVGLKEEDIGKYQKDLSGVLDYFKTLEEVDTKGIEPIGHITGMTDVMREDKRGKEEEQSKKEIMENAPETRDGYFKVKSVL